MHHHLSKILQLNLQILTFALLHMYLDNPCNEGRYYKMHTFIQPKVTQNLTKLGQTWFLKLSQFASSSEPC